VCSAGWGPPGPDWDAGGRRYPPFDDGGRYRHPYDSRGGGFDRPGSPPIPRRGPPNGGPGGWNRPVSPSFPPDYDRPAGGGRAWGAGAGWDGPVDRRRGPSADRDAGWGVSAAPSRGPATSAAAVPLEALSPEREEPRLPSPPKQALPTAPPTALPAPPSRRSQREVSPTATPSEATIALDDGRSNGLPEAAHTPSGQQQRPNGQHRSSELPGSSVVAEAAADTAKPQPASDSRAAANTDQVKAPVSAATSEAPTARVWYYVDPQVGSIGCCS